MGRRGGGETCWEGGIRKWAALRPLFALGLFMAIAAALLLSDTSRLPPDFPGLHQPVPTTSLLLGTSTRISPTHNKHITPLTLPILPPPPRMVTTPLLLVRLVPVLLTCVLLQANSRAWGHQELPQGPPSGSSWADRAGKYPRQREEEQQQQQGERVGS